MNLVVLTGSVATAPRKVAEGIVVLNVVAIGQYNRKTQKNNTSLVPVKVMGKKADYILEYAEKGQQIDVNAFMESRVKDNQYYCDIVVNDFEGSVRLGHKSMKFEKEEE